MTLSIHSLRPRTSVAFLVAAVLATSPTLASDSGVPAQPSQASSRAQALFQEGRARYDVGEYDQAIARFREAYELEPAPLLLFNIGQAERRQGNCSRARDSYSGFIRLAPEAEQAEQAREYLRELNGICPEDDRPAVSVRPLAAPLAVASAPAALSVVQPTPSSSLSQEAQSSGSSRSRMRLVGNICLGGALVLGTSALGLDLWNDARFSSWQSEDGKLATAAANTPDAARRQRDNDAALSSIHRLDRVEIALAITAGLSLAGWVVVYVLSNKTESTRSLTYDSGAVLAW
jgi:tetratricopeptide (TPR) repeat protein